MKNAIKFIQRFRIYILAIMIVAAIIVVINVLDSKTSEESVYNDGYTEITSVPGVKFDVQKNYADSAQAVLEISKKINFLDYQTYSYRNGTDMYLLFNIKKTIVIVKKGTEFDLSSGTNMLKKMTLNGIWFTPLGSVEKDGNKSSVDVSAEVIITNDVYNDFTGRLCTIKENNEEYSLFVGSSDVNVIDHICNSFSLYTNNKNIAETYAVDISTSEKSVVQQETVVEQQEEIIKTEEIEIVSEPDDKPKENEEKEITITPPTQEETEASEKGDSLELKTNQKNIVKEEGKAYSSSIYSMLSVGDTGFTSVQTENGSYTNAYIKVTKCYDSNETQRKIDEYIASGKSYYKEFEVPKGSHLESVQYDIMSDANAYLNIYFKGLDGENLKNNGVEASARTFDILSDREKDGWVTGNIVFYIVPNGCTEYVLQFGDGEDAEKGFYHIKN